MTAPEQAVQQARAAAAQMRASGAYAEEHSVAPEAEPGLEGLFEWARIEPDLEDVRSTRRFGAPITALKRGLLRLLQQYHAQLLADQTRFNVHVLGHLRRLENRIEELERRLDADGPPNG